MASAPGPKRDLLFWRHLPGLRSRLRLSNTGDASKTSRASPGDRAAQESPEAASTQWCAVADQIRPNVPKLTTIMEDAEPYVLAYMTFPKEHRPKLHPTARSSAFNGEINRRTDVVGILPNNEAIIGLVGTILLDNRTINGPCNAPVNDAGNHQPDER